MVKIEISSKKPKTTTASPFPYPSKTVNLTPSGNLYTEINRRQNIIKSILDKCTLKPGDVCVASVPEDRDKYGDITVLNIAQNYQELGKDYEWKTDNPLLVYAQSKNSSRFFCTVNFLEKKNVNTTQAC